jgi:hypothetical protein
VALLQTQPLPTDPAGSEHSAARSHWSVRRWVWMSALASVAAFALGGVYGVPAATSSPDYTAQALAIVHESTTTTLASTTTTSTSTTTTTAPPATTTTTAPTPASPAIPAPAPAPAPAVLASTPPPAPAAPALPAYGHATAWGCAAALAYLQAYAAPGFALDCPGYAEGHEAMTCLHGTPQYPDACLNGPEIAISDACPQAYMNESANSWLLTGQSGTEQAKFGVSYGEIDPFGACP